MLYTCGKFHRLGYPLFRTVLMIYHGQNTVRKFYEPHSPVIGFMNTPNFCSKASKDPEPVIKWKIDLKSASFMMIFATSLDDAEKINDEIGADIIKLIKTYFLPHLKDAALRFSLMKKTVPSLPESVKNVVMTDSKKQGELVYGGSEMVDVNIIKQFNVRNFLGGKGAVRFWYAPILELPVSGSVMKRVNVIRYKEKWVGDDGKLLEDDEYLPIMEAFQGEDGKVYGEAVRKLLTKENVDHGFLWVGFF